MNVNKILVPHDFSEYGDIAMTLAASFAHDCDACLIILHVMGPFEPYDVDKEYGIMDRYPGAETLQRSLEKIVPTDSTIDYEHRLVIGEPADLILEVAEKERAELIVMGTHGRSGLARVLTGSVAEAVIRRSRLPVITVKRPPTETVHEADEQRYLMPRPGLLGGAG